MKFRAFSILELTFALFISALLVSFAYFSLQVLSSRVSNYSQVLNSESEVARLYMMLAIDIDEADRIEKLDNRLLFRKTAESITYEFSETAIIRHSTSPDSISVQNADVQVSNPVIDEENDANQETIWINFEYGAANSTSNFTFLKSYDAETSLN